MCTRKPSLRATRQTAGWSSKSVQADIPSRVDNFLFYHGAGSRIRTDDLLITNQLLYQLSYAGIYYGKPTLAREILFSINPQAIMPEL